MCGVFCTRQCAFRIPRFYALCSVRSVHRGGELHCHGSLIERHRGYGAKLSREGMLRLSNCTVVRNRHGLSVDTQTALSVSEAIDMMTFEPQPDWPQPPSHAHTCQWR